MSGRPYDRTHRDSRPSRHLPFVMRLEVLCDRRRGLTDACYLSTMRSCLLLLNALGCPMPVYPSKALHDASAFETTAQVLEGRGLASAAGADRHGRDHHSASCRWRRF